MYEMRSGALLCIFVNKSKTTEPILEKVIQESELNWEITVDKYIEYPEKNAVYRMIIIRKLRLHSRDYDHP